MIEIGELAIQGRVQVQVRGTGTIEMIETNVGGTKMSKNDCGSGKDPSLPVRGME